LPDLHEIEAADFQKRLDFCCWIKGLSNNAIEWYDKKVLVFCAMSSKRIYVPYFFESTVNEDRYHKILVHFFWPKIVREDFRKYYFQQDGASPHRGKKSKNIYNRNL